MVVVERSLQEIIYIEKNYALNNLCLNFTDVDDNERRSKSLVKFW